MTDDGKYYPYMGKDELIGYCDINCETPRALFSREMFAQMVEYAGRPENYQAPDEIINGPEFRSMKENMKTLVDLARSQQT